MNVTPGKLSGLLIIEPKAHGDARGFFMETWNQRRYRDAGLTAAFVQDNVSLSRKGILRGLHFQNPSSQGKLVSVLHGAVLDVAVDVRRSSPTFGKWEAVELNDTNHRQFFVPPGFAHGFLVLSDTAMFHYKCTEFYSPKDEVTIRWNDPSISVAWPVSTPLVSEKDAKAPFLKDIPPDRLFP